MQLFLSVVPYTQKKNWEKGCIFRAALLLLIVWEHHSGQSETSESAAWFGRQKWKRDWKTETFVWQRTSLFLVKTPKLNAAYKSSVVSSSTVASATLDRDTEDDKEPVLFSPTPYVRLSWLWGSCGLKVREVSLWLEGHWFDRIKSGWERWKKATLGLPHQHYCDALSFCCPAVQVLLCDLLLMFLNNNKTLAWFDCSKVIILFDYLSMLDKWIQIYAFSPYCLIRVNRHIVI